MVERLRRARGDDRGTPAPEPTFILPIFLLIVYGRLPVGLARIGATYSVAVS